MQRRIENAPDEDGVVEAPASPLEPELAIAVAEQDALVEEDKTRAEQLEALEDEDRKIRDAMPERDGESEETNS